jgi:uncharacterized membrane protein
MSARALVWLLPALLLAPVPALAQRSIEIPRFHSRVVVEADGAIDVTETFTARFTGSWNGIYRTVPVKYRTPQGFNWTIRIDLVSATDDQGRDLRTESSRERHYLKYKIWVPGAQDAERTIVLRYKAHNALRFFEDHDELYWNATGDEWDVPLGMVSADVELPSGATGIRTTAFNGVVGSTLREAEIAEEGSLIRFRMPRPLEYLEGMTVVVGWDKGLIPEPTAVDKVQGFLASNWPLGIPFAVLAAMLTLWFRIGRDPRKRPIAVQYEPPEDFTPAEAGTLTDERVDMRDITATMVDLAVRGFLRIEETEEDVLFGLTTKKEFTFHRLRPESDWAALAPHERNVLRGVFKDGSVVPLSDLKDEFYTELSGIKNGVMNQLTLKQLYRRRPDHVRAWWIAGGFVCLLIVMFGGGVLSSALQQQLSPAPFVAAGIVSAIIIVAIGWNMPARTVDGTRMLERVLGFSEFLERVDKDKYEHVKRTPEMFERFLPYAMALGVEQQWAKAFKDIYMEPPTWYTGSNIHLFNATTFSRSLSSMSTTAATAMSSSPRSSSGSGFGGGGFSGGGGGGGGGGGF